MVDPVVAVVRSVVVLLPAVFLLPVVFLRLLRLL
jgi:hypothetical protein